MRRYTMNRKAMSKNQAIAEISKYSGIQFDPTLVNIFLKILETEKSNPFIDK